MVREDVDGGRLLVGRGSGWKIRPVETDSWRFGYTSGKIGNVEEI
jgi:hypothetical protein